MTQAMEAYAAETKARFESGEWEGPPGAREGDFCIGALIMVSRDSIASEVRNPDLPEWFPARVCLPPDEPGNWYRWYDPFIWYETEIDLSNGGEWATAKRNMAYVGKLWSAPRPSKMTDSGWWQPSSWWAIPVGVLPAEPEDGE